MDEFKKLIPNLPGLQPEGSQNLPSGVFSASVQFQAFCLRKAQELFGCYRRDEASNPEVYSAAIAAVFSGFSETVVAKVADPRVGIASELKFLPSVAEVKEACVAAEKLERTLYEPIPARVPYAPVRHKKAPGTDYFSMFEKHGRPIGVFEKAGDKWNQHISDKEGVAPKPGIEPGTT